MCGGGSRQGVRPLGTEQHLNGHWQLVRNGWTHGVQVPLSICQRRQFGYIWRQRMAAQILWLEKIRFYNWQKPAGDGSPCFPHWKPPKSLFLNFESLFLILAIIYYQWKQAEIFPNGMYCETRTYSPRAQSFINAHKKLLWHFLEGKVPKTSDKLKLNYENRANLAIQGNHGNNSLMLSSNFAIVDTNNHCIFPLSNKRFHVCIGEFQVLLYQCFFLLNKKSKTVIWRFPVARSEEK